MYKYSMNFVGNPFLFQTQFTGLLDTYTGAEVAYSVRWLNSAYTGALVRIRRSSDNAEEDFYPDSNNELSLSSTNLGGGTVLGTWIGASSGFIRTWYDQSGNANNLTRTVAADQPRIINAGVLEVDPNNGNVAMFFDGSNDHFNIGSSISVVQVCYHHFVFNRASTGIMSAGISNNLGTPFGFLWFSNNGQYSGYNATTLHDGGQTGTGDFIVTTLRDSSDNVKLWTNGSAGTTKTDSGATKSYTLAFNRNGNVHNGYAQELILWHADHESSQSSIETDANNYFNVF